MEIDFPFMFSEILNTLEKSQLSIFAFLNVFLVKKGFTNFITVSLFSIGSKYDGAKAILDAEYPKVFNSLLKKSPLKWQKSLKSLPRQRLRHRKRRVQDRSALHLRAGSHRGGQGTLRRGRHRHVPQRPLRGVSRRGGAGLRHRRHDLCRAGLPEQPHRLRKRALCAALRRRGG